MALVALVVGAAAGVWAIAGLAIVALAVTAIPHVGEYGRQNP
jgi:hypothetical protein